MLLGFEGIRVCACVRSGEAARPVSGGPGGVAGGCACCLRTGQWTRASYFSLCATCVV